MQDTATRDLIQVLVGRQNAEGVNDLTFAEARLHINHAAWWRLKRGKQGMSLQTLAAILQAYPYLEDEVLSFLRAIVPDVPYTKQQSRYSGSVTSEPAGSQ